MDLSFGSGSIEYIYFLLVLLWAFYAYVTMHYSYWKYKGVPCAESVFPFGTLYNFALGKYHLGETYDELSKQFENERFFGIIDVRKPALVVKDPELIKHILTKDFNHFTDRLPFPSALKKEYMSNNIIFVKGTEWQRLKMAMSPAFTVGKIKMMYSMMEKSCNQLLDNWGSDSKMALDVDIGENMLRLFTDMSCLCTLGLEANTLTTKKSEMYSFSCKSLQISNLRLTLKLFYEFFPFLSNIYAPSVVPPDSTEFFSNIVRNVIILRKHNTIISHSLIDNILKSCHDKLSSTENYTRNEGNKLEDFDYGIKIEEIIAQLYVFFYAAFENPTYTCSFCLYELACNPVIQEHVFQEIKEVVSNHGGTVTYDSLQEMKYLDQVVSETLRLYGTVPIITRICSESYQVPNSKLVIEKGIKVTIPVYSIHHDPKNYPDPYRFDPGRFSPEKSRERHPYTFLGFGEGPRICIGMRFGLMEVKTALAKLIINYKFDVSPDMERPIKIMKRGFFTLPEKPILLRLEKRMNGVKLNGVLC